MKSFLKTALTACLLTSLLCLPASASVASTTHPAAGDDSVYVAGNPGWYPIEYYDGDAGCYKGLLPSLFEDVGQKTGLSFTYISASAEDQHGHLGKNGQAEVISGLTGGGLEANEYGVTRLYTVLTLSLIHI